MPLDFPGLLEDLDQESNWLLTVVSALSPSEWLLPTPAEGWSVNDQILHLQFFDEATKLAITDAAAFRNKADELTRLGEDFPAILADRMRRTPPKDALATFRESRDSLQQQFTSCEPRSRMPWYGPDMSIASAATARLMETWAHGQDIYDALGLVHPIGRGLRSVAHLGVTTFGFAHSLHGLDIPTDAVRLELTPPDGGTSWSWGPADAANRVTGPALDFVLVVTQRRHITEVALSTAGPVAARWMNIAQAYAGARGAGRSPERG